MSVLYSYGALLYLAITAVYLSTVFNVLWFSVNTISLLANLPGSSWELLRLMLPSEYQVIATFWLYSVGVCCFAYCCYWLCLYYGGGNGIPLILANVITPLLGTVGMGHLLLMYFL